MQPDSNRDGAHDVRRRELPGLAAACLAAACRALAAGGAAVVPNPAPMAYGIVSTSPEVLNAVKRRRAGQNVAVSVHHPTQWRRLAPCVDLSPGLLGAVVGLLRRRMTVLVPLRSRVPPPRWVLPALRDGYLAVFNGYWVATARVWQQFPRLYGSSANLTGRPPAATAAQAVAMFGGRCAVVDAEPPDAGDPAGPRMASTMVRTDRAGLLEMYRPGAHDAASGLGPDRFVRHLAADVGLWPGRAEPPTCAADPR